jgi:hypothetical protein
MKKIVILIIAIFISYGVTQAGTENTIQSMIRKQISVPSELKKQKLDEMVFVQFKLENGKAEVLDVKTNNPELKNYVIERFKSISFDKTTEKQGVVYFIDINFRVL